MADSARTEGAASRSGKREMRLGWIVGVREITTTIVAIAVLAVTMLMLWETYQGAVEWKEKRDIMLYGLPILGSVVGYYFGRAPAERRAEVAEASRSKAEDTASQAAEVATGAQRQAEQRTAEKDQAEVKLSKAKSGYARIKNLAEQGPSAQRKTLGGVTADAPAPQDLSLQILAEVEATLREL